MNVEYKSLFPYMGGKSTVADLVWQRFGKVNAYREPFTGSGAVFWMCPHQPSNVILNEINPYIVNVWRAINADPDTVAHYADNPVFEADLHSRHLWLVQQSEFRERMITDPDYHDCKIAGWWLWGASCWIGSGWCDYLRYEKKQSVSRKLPWATYEAGVSRQSPRFTGQQGVNAGVWQARPHLGAEQGVIARQIRNLTSYDGVHRKRQDVFDRGIRTENTHLAELMCTFQAKMRYAKITCGDWARCVTPVLTSNWGAPVAVFLDPPYSFEAKRDNSLYANESGTVAHDVREWCKANGQHKNLRLALCGYAGEHDELESLGWQRHEWKANGGYGNQGNGVGKSNAKREVIWFSPFCEKPAPTLFDFAQDFAQDEVTA